MACWILAVLLYTSVGGAMVFLLGRRAGVRESSLSLGLLDAVRSGVSASLAPLVDSAAKSMQGALLQQLPEREMLTAFSSWVVHSWATQAVMPALMG